MHTSISPERIFTDAGAIHRVCFVCTGNTCRSPMAAAVYNYLHRGEKTRAISAGIAACDGDPIHPYALEALRAEGIPCTPENDYEHHKAQLITREIVESSNEILCMTPSHLVGLLCSFPDSATKFSAPYEIPDPFGGDPDYYREILRRIIAALKEETL